MVLTQITLIFFFLFLIFTSMFALGLKRDAKTWVLVSLALAATLCFAAAEYGLYLLVKSL